MWEDIAASFPSPPRIVRRKSGTGCAVAFPRLFMLPHMLVGIAFALALPAHWYVNNFGTPVTARIDNVEYRVSEKGGGSYDTRYHYEFRGQRFEESGSGNEHTRIGDIFPGHAANVVLFIKFVPTPDNEDIKGLFFFALVWNSLMLPFYYVIWYIPIRDRRLVQYGEATPGVITKLWQTTGRGAACHAQYEYTTPAGDTITRKKREVNTMAYLQAREGDVITVLYNPAKPKRGLPYELSDFEIVDPAM